MGISIVIKTIIYKENCFHEILIILQRSILFEYDAYMIYTTELLHFFFVFGFLLN